MQRLLMRLQVSRTGEYMTATIDDLNSIERADYAIAAELAELVTPDQLAAWKRDGDIFAIDKNGFDLFPRYAFDFGPVTRPKPLMRKILAAIGLTGWDAAYWFCCSCNALRGRRPHDIFGKNPQAVLQATISEQQEPNPWTIRPSAGDKP